MLFGERRTGQDTICSVSIFRYGKGFVVLYGWDFDSDDGVQPRLLLILCWEFDDGVLFMLLDIDAWLKVIADILFEAK